MKKLLLSVVAFTMMASFAFAQLSGGVRVGLNLANQKDKFDGGSESGDIKPGFQVGAYLVGNLSDKIAIQPELTFSVLGTKISDPDVGDIKLNLNYITIPIFLRYNINDILNIHLGPQFGILASAKGKADGGSADIKSQYKSLDVGAAVGLGLDFGKFNAAARYYQGLSNIAEGADSGETLKNSSIQVVLGYRLFGGN
jgi:hypothetical protein